MMDLDMSLALVEVEGVREMFRTVRFLECRNPFLRIEMEDRSREVVERDLCLILLHIDLDDDGRGVIRVMR